MTLRLILMRHAKSGWDNPALSDHERPLNTRGIASAQATGNWLRDKGYLPDLVLSSDATRTSETFAGLALDCDVRFLNTLYLASSTEILGVLSKSGVTSCVLILGHNAGIGDAAMRLCNAPATDPDFPRFPTCATALFDFDIPDWDQLRFGSGTLKDFTVPRRLLG